MNYSEITPYIQQLSAYRSLPPSFVRDMILKAPGKDMMNISLYFVLKDLILGQGLKSLDVLGVV